MSNYKVKVNNEAESKEVQGLFEQLGYEKGTNISKEYPKFIITSNWLGRPHSSGADLLFNEANTKELTTQQLKDLVVLKRNSIDDATHACETIYRKKGYLTSDNVEYFWNYIDERWFISNNSFESEKLKPIEKKEMKEYLVPQDNGKYALTKATEKRVSDWVEVPEGAEAFYYFNRRENVFFTKHHEGKVLFSNALNDWSWGSYGDKIVGDEVLLWNRHTQPEELQFVDDEPKSLNDTYAEIEQVRTAEQINQASMHHIIERGKTYDSEAGERSAHKTALAFNAITGHNLNESEVFLLLQILKDVRQWSKADYHQDSAEDSISYAVLKSEALERNK